MQDWLVAIVVAGITAVSLLTKTLIERGRKSQAVSLLEHYQLLAAMPPGEARQAYEQYLADKTRAMVISESQLKRSGMSTGMGVVFSGGAVACVWGFFGAPLLVQIVLAILFVPCLIFGVYGLWDGLTKAQRDEKGLRITAQNKKTPGPSAIPAEDPRRP